ncbi:S1 family peptidase [Streptomyces sp.]|uniref:S1 family peptidase n=1 Tax=Streptomyces sp. TaxID=1931 RepID=UPI002F41C694
MTRRARTIAAASGLLAVLALAAPSAAAGPAHRIGVGQLAAASDALAEADVAGSAWYADAASGRLVVTADSRVDARGVDRIERAAKDLPGALVIHRVPGVLRPLIAGGQPIYAPGYRCTLGFNVRDSGGGYYALVAGHCVTQATTWYIDPAMTQILGTVVAASFPGDDFAVIKYVNPANADGRVYLHNGTYQDVTQAGNAYVGQVVKRSGYVTGVRSGTVTAVNVTVNYGGGNVVYGLVQTNVCSEPGDSGAPFFSGTTALGLTSGGSGNCSTGGTTYYQPVTEALSAYQLAVF